jgi:hypothetical protein
MDQVVGHCLLAKRYIRMYSISSQGRSLLFIIKQNEPLSRVLTTVTSTESSHNNSDHWVRDATTNTRRRASGRGMFSGLQDVKHYNVEHGWARRDVDHRPGFFGALWNNITGGSV